MRAELPGAQPPLRYVPPRFRGALFRTLRPAFTPYRRWVFGVERPELRNVESLVREYARFQAGESRLILAYRHPNKDDPPLTAYVMAAMLPREARRLGVRLAGPTFAHFIYGIGITQWNSPMVGWLLPRFAGIPIYHKKFDPRGINAVRRLFTDGRFPLAIAPEGQVTYHNHRIYPLSAGVARLALYCRQDLLKAGRREEVVILPVSLHYRYQDVSPADFDRRLSVIERECGLPPPPEGAHRPYDRVRRIAEHLVEYMEGIYSRFHHARFPRPEGRDWRAAWQRRLEAVIEAAVSIVETAYGLKPLGDIINRLIVARETGWDWIHRRDIAGSAGLSPMERAVADRKARESRLLLSHIELADLGSYLRAGDLAPDLGPNGLMETVLNLHDLVRRLAGGNVSDRAPDGRKAVTFTFGDPISVTERWDARTGDRRAAVDDCVAELGKQFEEMHRQIPD